MVKVRLFANFRETVGASELKIEAEDLEELVDKLINLYPDLKQLFSKKNYAKFAVNRILVSENVKLRKKDEVAIFPPVSGG